MTIHCRLSKSTSSGFRRTGTRTASGIELSSRSAGSRVVACRPWTLLSYASPTGRCGPRTASSVLSRNLGYSSPSQLLALACCSFPEPLCHPSRNGSDECCQGGVSSGTPCDRMTCRVCLQRLRTRCGDHLGLERAMPSTASQWYQCSAGPHSCSYSSALF